MSTKYAIAPAIRAYLTNLKGFTPYSMADALAAVASGSPDAVLRHVDLPLIAVENASLGRAICGLLLQEKDSNWLTEQDRENLLSILGARLDLTACLADAYSHAEMATALNQKEGAQ